MPEKPPALAGGVNTLYKVTVDHQSGHWRGVREQNRVDRELVERLVAREGSLAGAARRLNLPESTLRSQLSLRACPECDRPHDPRAKRCWSCEAARRRGWTTHDLLERRERWRERYGDPPSTYDWNATLGPRFQAGQWPSAATVLRHFGSWPAFLTAELADCLSLEQS